jgi:hypothetical protein
LPYTIGRPVDRLGDAGRGEVGGLQHFNWSEYQ